MLLSSRMTAPVRGEAPSDDGTQGWRCAGAQRSRHLVQDRGAQLEVRLPGERPRPGRHLVQHDAECPHIDLGLCGLTAQLIGCHVRKRADRRAELRQRRLLGDCRTPVTGGRALRKPARTACAAAALPLIHRDAFDRVLVALAQQRALTVLTSDENIPKYDGVQTVWSSLDS
jgi:hypothetical protein